MKEKKEKFLFVRFIPGFDQNRNPIYIKSHESINESNFYEMLKEKSAEGFTRVHGGYKRVIVENFKNYKEALLITVEKFPHDLAEALETYYKFIKEKDLEEKKKFEGKLFTFDMEAGASEVEKEEHIASQFDKQTKRREKRKKKIVESN